MANCGADTEANRLLPELTQDAVFPIPNADLSGIVFPDDALNTPVVPLKISDVSDGTVSGNGVFDALMRAFKAHLDVEFDSNRITGDDYTKAYIALTESAMNQGVNFLLQKDQAFWSAQLIQVQAFAARVELETAKIRLVEAQYSAANQKANYALTKMQIATADNEYCISKFNLEQMLPAQLARLELEKAGLTIDNETAAYNLASILPKQLEKLGLENDGQTTENSISAYNLTNLLPKQLEKLGLDIVGQSTANSTATYNLGTMLPQQLNLLLAQEGMVKEQTESQHAQTSDLRSDGQPVVGVLGKQKDLYTQQITSYKRDSEIKGGKLFTDAWITMKSIDEGLLPPDGFTNTSIDTVLTAIKVNNELD